ncbi:hypothetical protein [Sandaracinus amylolyticus]|uniref:hypothetical protein n=1 Tax=Sandaracinus amylolyticus TaxID=927083 RepID=UPI001F3994D3|nr:hypothetical protein [Sandaracinus amylolyticus]UJR87024.1 Hypothetical protein I5071_91250 [Sandaracinus amylolyticus]
MSARAPLGILAVLVLVACGSDEDEAREACMDVERALAARCDAPFDEEFAEDQCRDVVGIRDREELYEECIPAIEALPCGEGEVPESCIGQLYVDE